MGYRSEVCAGIMAPDVDFFVGMIAELKLADKLEGFDPMFEAKEGEPNHEWFFSDVRIYKAEVTAWWKPSPTTEATHNRVDVVVMEYRTSEPLRWYNGDYAPNLWEAMKEIANRAGMAWQFVRIGEEQGDVQDESGFDGAISDNTQIIEYMKSRGMLKGDMDDDKKVGMMVSALADGMSLFRLETIVESSEIYSVKENGTLIVKDILTQGESNEPNN